MKILQICTSDKGGAAHAAIRLHLALLAQGVNSKILVLKKFKKTPQSYIFRADFLLNRYQNFWNRLLKETKNKLEKSQLEGQPKGFEMFSFVDSWFDIRQSKYFQEADIIHLHWVAGFLDYRSFFQEHSKKIIWTLHDMNPFTGGCHYASDCRNYLTDCSNCPQLKGIRKPNLARQFFQVKQQAFEGTNLHIVSPSKWLFEEAKSSALLGKFSNYYIPNGLNFQEFKATSKKEARQILNLPLDKKIIFFTAQDTTNIRKGFHLLQEALTHFEKIGNTADLVVYTAGKEGGFSLPKIEIIEAGTITSAEKMALAYSASDLFVIPSLEDNLPNTVLESLACGTPVVGFRIGGIPDMIQDGENGFLVDEISSTKLAQTLHYALQNLIQFDSQKIRANCQAKYAPEIQAKAYLDIY